MSFILRGDESPETQDPGDPRRGGGRDAAPALLQWHGGRAVLTGPAGDRVDLPIELLLGARIEEAARADGSGVDLRLVVDLGDGHGGAHSSGGGRVRVQLVFPPESGAHLTSAIRKLLDTRDLHQQVPPARGPRLTGPHPDIPPAVPSASATAGRARHAAPDPGAPEQWQPPVAALVRGAAPRESAGPRAVPPASDDAEWLSFRPLPGSDEIFAQYPHG